MKIDHDTLSAVAVIGVHLPGVGHPLAPQWVGTGIVVGLKSGDDVHIFIVTNKHVIRYQRALTVRINLKGSLSSQDYIVQLYDPSGVPLYSLHPSNDVDVVAISLDGTINDSQKPLVSCFDSSTTCLKLHQMEALGFGEGSCVFALGFPMNLVDMKHSFAICRTGCISRISSSYGGLDPVDYLIDAQTFPGNSGGPVVIGMENDSMQQFGLTGIVHSYIPYQETLYSAQTQRPRSMMEENSGLTCVHPYDRIDECIRIECARVQLSQIKKKAI